MTVGLFVDSFERTGIKLFVKISDTFVGDAIESLVDESKEPIIDEFASTNASIFAADVQSLNTTLSGQCERCHVTIFSDGFQDSVIDRPHPVGWLANHIRFSIGTDVNPSGVLTSSTRRVIESLSSGNFSLTVG